MVDSRERPVVNAGRPRAFLAKMISSKRRIDGIDGGFRSRSWMNSLKAVWSYHVSQPILLPTQPRKNLKRQIKGPRKKDRMRGRAE